MKRFVSTQLIIMLVVFVYFIVIYLMTGISVLSGINTEKPLVQPGQRLLSEWDQDPLLVHGEALRNVTHSFRNAKYTSLSGARPIQAAQVLIENHALRYPLHLFVETKAKQSEKSRSVDRTVKRVYN